MVLWWLVLIVKLAESTITWKTGLCTCLEVVISIMLIKIWRAILIVGGLNPWTEDPKLIIYRIKTEYYDNCIHFSLFLFVSWFLCCSCCCFVYFCLFGFWDKIFPHNLGWPGTHYVDQVNLKLVEIQLPLSVEIKCVHHYHCADCAFNILPVDEMWPAVSRSWYLIFPAMTDWTCEMFSLKLLLSGYFVTATGKETETGITVLWVTLLQAKK